MRGYVCVLLPEREDLKGLFKKKVLKAPSLDAMEKEIAKAVASIAKLKAKQSK